MKQTAQAIRETLILKETEQPIRETLILKETEQPIKETLTLKETAQAIRERPWPTEQFQTTTIKFISPKTDAFSAT